LVGPSLDFLPGYAFVEAAVEYDGYGGEFLVGEVEQI